MKSIKVHIYVVGQVLDEPQGHVWLSYRELDTVVKARNSEDPYG